MTPELTTEITDTGIVPDIISGITDMAENVRDADVTQENQKTAGKIFTQEAVTEFNEIYTQIIGICKVGSKLFKSNKLSAEHFNFARIVRAMNFAKANKPLEGNE